MLRKYLILGNLIHLPNTLLSKEKLNVISDEDLTLHGFFHKARFGIDVNAIDYPSKLKAIFGDDVKVNILVTLRSQPDLIFSCFVQKYPFIRSTYGKITFKNFIRDKVFDFFDLYQFDKIIEIYQKTFNSKVSIALFEDFISEQSAFWQDLSALLPASTEELMLYKGNAHHNKKNKTKEYVRSYYNALSPTGKLISPAFGGEKKFMQLLNRRHNLNTYFMKPYESKLLIRTIEENVSLPDEEDITYLKNMFAESNLLLAEKYRINEQKLKLYNYI